MASHCHSRTIGWKRRLRAVAARRGEQLGKSGSPLGLPLDTRLPSFGIATGSQKKGAAGQFVAQEEAAPLHAWPLAFSQPPTMRPISWSSSLAKP
jgi:hypothetical protein